MPEVTPSYTEPYIGRVAVQLTNGLLKIDVKSVVPDFDVSFFHVMSTYLDLVETLRLVPTTGLERLHVYRSGILDLNYKPPKQDLSDREYGTRLVKFANSCICFNMATLVNIAISAMRLDMENMYGNRINNACSMDFVSPEMAKQMGRFIDFRAIDNHDRNDVLMELARACYNQAYARISSHMSPHRVIRFFDFVEKTSFSMMNYKDEYMQLYKAIFYIACAFYKVGPEELIQLREPVDFHNALRIIDTTLAAVPLTPIMNNTCADTERPSSTAAIQFLHALELFYSKSANFVYPRINLDV